MDNKTNPVVLFFKESWLLVVAALVFGLLLASIKIAWQPKIDEHALNKINESLAMLIPETTAETVWTDKKVDFGKQGILTVKLFKANKDDECLGWAFTATGPGYADKIDLMIAVDKDFNKTLGYRVLYSNETTGFGDKIKNDFYKNQFKGAPATELELKKLGKDGDIDNTIIAISGATISSDAVVAIFNSYIPVVKKNMQDEGLIK